MARSSSPRTTAHPSSRERTCTGGLFATRLTSGQAVGDAAQPTLVIAPLLVALLLSLLCLGLGLPGLRPLLGPLGGRGPRLPRLALGAPRLVAAPGPPPSRPAAPRPRPAWSSPSAGPPRRPRPWSARRGPRLSWPRRRS